MKDIFFIGGPESVTGVDRIGDDLLSILKAEHLYDRKTVVVWPTDSFLAPPSDTTLLEIHLDMNSVKNDQMSRQSLMAGLKHPTVIPGGQNLAVVIDNAPRYALCWCELTKGWATTP